jgi:diamine N-acetyltransferase
MLKGKGIYLRALEPEDVHVLYQWENNTEVWHLSTTLVPYSLDLLKRYIKQAQLDIYTTKQLRLVICSQQGIAVGCIDLFDFEPYHLRAGVGILIADASERRKGYAKEALQLLINYCSQHLRLRQVYCNILEDNLASKQLFVGAGFKHCGTKEQWIRKENKWLTEQMFQLIL